MGEIKPVFMELDSDLWKEAKIQAIKDSLDLKDWVANAIKEKLDKSGNNHDSKD